MRSHITHIKSLSLLPLLITGVVLMLLMPSVAQAQSYYTNSYGTWTYRQSTILKYTGFGGDVTIPGVIYNGPITSIGVFAFWPDSSLTSVTIPGSVTYIGQFAFGQTGLTSVTIPNSVTSMGDEVFEGCTDLTNVTFGYGVTIILWSSWFLGCTRLASITVDPLNSVYSSVDGVLSDKSQTRLIFCPSGKPGTYSMPDSVTSIEDYAFWACGGLTSVTIGNSVTNIADSAFSGCTSLTSVTIPNSVTSIGDSAFSGCSSLTNVTIPNTNVTIPNSVTSIGDSAFSGCESRTNVKVGNNVTSIGANAFASCTNLTAITVDPLNPVYSSLDGVLFDRGQTTLILCPQGKTGTYTIPNSVTNIATGSFNNCSRLTSVTIPNVVTSIGDGSFSSCTSLSAIRVNPLNAVYSSVDGVLFNEDQTMLIQYPPGKAGNSYTILSNVTSIGDSAFSGCESLPNITIGNSVTNIANSAFSGSTS